MILPYALRLVCLTLAAFFLIHLALAMAVSCVSPWAVRMAERINPRLAARGLLALRFFPLGFSVLVVAGLCVPSYLWLEPEATAEQVSLGCLAAALLGMAIWAISIWRGLRAATRSLRYIRHCQLVGRATRLAGEQSPVWVIEGAGHLLALAGVIRPRLVISQEVLNALSTEQLAAALRHEGSHRISRDNLKRLLILLAPGIFPFFGGFGSLEQGWARISEWAADDRAVAGSSCRSVWLATALVRVARLSAMPRPSPLMTSLLDNSQDLSARVDRLLRPALPHEQPGRGLGSVVASATLVLAASVAVMLQPAVLSGAHRLIEHLIH